MKFITLLLAAGALLATSSAHAQMGGPQKEVYIPDVDVESFIWQMPAKWHAFSKNTDAKDVTMLFPFGQKPQKYKESLTYTGFSSTLGATSAKQVKDIFVTANEKTCESHSVEETLSGPPGGGMGGPPGGGMGNPEDDENESRPEGRPEGGPPGDRPDRGERGVENGYSTVTWEEVCETGKDVQYSLNKVILGNEKLYTAKKTWKSKPKKRSKEKWLEELSQIYVCDPRTGVNECVPPNGPPGGMGGPR